MDQIKIGSFIAGIVPFVVGIAYAIRIEQIAGFCECRHCHHKYVPAYTKMLFSVHAGRTRHLRCPECGKKSRQKKVISK